jgi:hypothetical protein
MSEFKIYPSTDDSAESLKHRPEPPVNRNWSWSPKAPGARHIIESVNYKDDDHSIGDAPYEIVEASDNILPENIEGSDPETERKEFNEEEIKKKKYSEDEEESDYESDEEFSDYQEESDPARN